MNKAIILALWHPQTLLDVFPSELYVLLYFSTQVYWNPFLNTGYHISERRINSPVKDKDEIWFEFFVLIEFAGHASATPAEAHAGIAGTALINVGLCSKFADCNKYCQENYSREFGGFCKVLSPWEENFCLCEVWDDACHRLIARVGHISQS